MILKTGTVSANFVPTTRFENFVSDRKFAFMLHKVKHLKTRTRILPYHFFPSIPFLSMSGYLLLARILLFNLAQKNTISGELEALTL